MPEPRLGGNFRRLWASSTLTALGDGIRLVALPLLAIRLTDDTALIALVTVCTFLSALVFGQIAGVIVDATRPVAIIVTAHLIRAATLVILALTILTGAASIATLCVAALVYGIAEAFADPATQSLIPRVVPRDSLARANSDLQTGMIVGQMFLGRALGGVLFALAAGLPLAVNALLLLAATPFAIGIRVTNTPARDKMGTRVGRFFRQLREGITIVLDSRLLAACRSCWPSGVRPQGRSGASPWSTPRPSLTRGPPDSGSCSRSPRWDHFSAPVLPSPSSASWAGPVAHSSRSC